MDIRHRKFIQLLAHDNGIVSRRQLLSIGFTDSMIKRWIHAGRLFVIHPGVYSAIPVVPHEAQLTAVVHTLDGVAGITAETAAKHVEIWRRNVRTIHATSTQSRHAPNGVTLMRSRNLTEADLRRVRNVTVTDTARIICDMSLRQTQFALANVMHEADFRNMFDAAAVRAMATRLKNRPTTCRVFRALELNAEGAAGTMSVSEDRFQELRIRAGLPEPWVNRRVDGATDIWRLDTFWPERLFNCEVDGGPHARPRSKRSDAEQDEDVQAVGIHVERFSTDAIWNEPQWVVFRLQELWSQGSALRTAPTTVWLPR